MGVLEDGYNKEMTVEEAKKLVIRSIKSAINRDVMSGDGIDLLIFTKEGAKEESVDF